MILANLLTVNFASSFASGSLLAWGMSVFERFEENWRSICVVVRGKDEGAKHPQCPRVNPTWAQLERDFWCLVRIATIRDLSHE